jgi:uncharacterized protein
VGYNQHGALETMPLKKPIVPYLNLSDSAGPCLEGLRCSGCNAVFIDTREACSKCYARGALVPFKLANTGKLYNWTIVHRNFPGIKVPFISAIVDLDGGGTVKGNLIEIEPDPSKLTFDMPVTVVFSAVTQTDATGSEFISYFFVPSLQEHGNQ